MAYFNKPFYSLSNLIRPISFSTNTAIASAAEMVVVYATNTHFASLSAGYYITPSLDQLTNFSTNIVSISSSLTDANDLTNINILNNIYSSLVTMLSTGTNVGPDLTKEQLQSLSAQYYG
jgi:hypothetical protein